MVPFRSYGCSESGTSSYACSCQVGPCIPTGNAWLLSYAPNVQLSHKIDAADTASAQASATHLASLHKELGALQPVVEALDAWDKAQVRSTKVYQAGSRSQPPCKSTDI